MSSGKSDAPKTREKAIRLFTFLKELTQLKTKVVKQVEDYEQVLWFNDVPKEVGCYSRAWGIADEDEPGIWLQIAKPTRHYLGDPMEFLDFKTAAVISQIVFYAYWLATEWIDLFPWNDLSSANRGDQIKGTIFHCGTAAFCIIAFLIGNRWLMGIAVIWFSILLTIEICNWWIPYFFGIHPAEVNKEVYAKHFSKTYRFLPPIKDHNIVDAQHVVIVFLTIIMWSVSLIAFFRSL